MNDTYNKKLIPNAKTLRKNMTKAVRIRLRINKYVVITVHHISQKSVAKSRFLPASPLGEASNSYIQPFGFI